MSQGPQEFCIGCIVPGVVMMFTKPMPVKAKRNTPTKTKRPQKIKQSKSTKPAKRKTAKPQIQREAKPEIKTNILSPDEQDRFDRYVVGRRI